MDPIGNPKDLGFPNAKGFANALSSTNLLCCTDTNIVSKTLHSTESRDSATFWVGILRWDAPDH